MGVEVVLGTVVEEEVVGDGDGAAFFEVFDFGVVAFLGVFRFEGALGAIRDTVVAERAGSDDGDDGHLAGEFVAEDFVFGPGIEAVEDDALLAGIDEVFRFGDRLADDPVGAFFGADFFAEGAFAVAIRGALDAAFFHFFVNHAAEVDFRHAAFGEIINYN